MFWIIFYCMLWYVRRKTHCWKYLETILSRAKRPDCTPSCSLFPSSNSESEESDSSLSVSESGCGSPRVVATLCRTIQEMVILHASAGSYLQKKTKLRLMLAIGSCIIVCHFLFFTITIILQVPGILALLL